MTTQQEQMRQLLDIMNESRVKQLDEINLKKALATAAIAGALSLGGAHSADAFPMAAQCAGKLGMVSMASDSPQIRKLADELLSKAGEYVEPSDGSLSGETMQKVLAKYHEIRKTQGNGAAQQYVMDTFSDCMGQVKTGFVMANQSRQTQKSQAPQQQASSDQYYLVNMNIEIPSSMSADDIAVPGKSKVVNFRGSRYIAIGPMSNEKAEQAVARDRSLVKVTLN